MPIKSRPFSLAQEVHWGSDVARVNLYSGELKIWVARCRRPDGQVDGLLVSFKHAPEFRYLDEVTLATWWMADGFVRDHHVLEITDGGWREELRALQGYEQARREWLVVTGNGCVSVISDEPPALQDVLWPADV
jgi:hypothetical protein